MARYSVREINNASNKPKTRGIVARTFFRVEVRVFDHGCSCHSVLLVRPAVNSDA